MNVETPTIGALAFNESLAPISFMKLTRVKSRSLSRIKRIEGSELLMLGLIQELLIVKFENAGFALLHTFMTYADYEIVGIQFHTNHIFFTTLGEQVLSVIELKAQVNQAEYYTTESMTPIVTEFYEMKLGLKKQSVAEAPKFEGDRDIVSYLANEDISYQVVMEDEQLLPARLAAAKACKHKAAHGCRRVTVSFADRALYVNTGLAVDMYKIEDAGLAPAKTVADASVHSVFAVNSLMVMQEQVTANLLIYNAGELFKTLQGKGAWPIQSRRR